MHTLAKYKTPDNNIVTRSKYTNNTVCKHVHLIAMKITDTKMCTTFSNNHLILNTNKRVSHLIFLLRKFLMQTRLP